MVIMFNILMVLCGTFLQISVVRAGDVPWMGEVEQPTATRIGYFEAWDHLRDPQLREAVLIKLRAIAQEPWDIDPGELKNVSYLNLLLQFGEPSDKEIVFAVARSAIADKKPRTSLWPEETLLKSPNPADQQLALAI